MQKVLIVGAKNFGYCKSLGNAFTQLGYSVNIFEGLKEGQVSTLPQIVKYKLSYNKVNFFKKRFLKECKQLISLFNTFKPDIVLVVRGESDLFDFLLTVKKTNCRLLFWAVDSLRRTPIAFKNLSFFEKIFVFEKTDIPFLAEKNITAAHLPMAADIEVYKPIAGLEKDIDILFIGSLDTTRVSILRQVIKRFPALKIKVYGYYFSKIFKPFRWLFRNDKQYFTNKTVTATNANLLYNRSKICLNIHHQQSVYGVNPRFFEVLASGSFLVSDKKPFAEKYFKELQPFYYDTPEQLFEIIKQQLSTQQKINVVEKIKREHSFLARVKTILN
jgi:spore maturation protein CgeB